MILQAQQIIDSNIYNMIAPTDINIYSFKTDYEQNFKKGRLGLGGKTSYVTSDNDFENYNVAQSVKYFDSLRSNNFTLQGKYQCPVCKLTTGHLRIFRYRLACV